MIRQTDDIRIQSKCYKPTRYYPECDKHEFSDDKEHMIGTCIYFMNGKCKLQYCVRRSQ